MKIIDAHLHFRPGEPYFDEIAQAAGHLNSEKHLRAQYEKYGVAAGIVMGNRGLALHNHQYPDFLRYCVGLDGSDLQQYTGDEAARLIEAHLRRESCVGIKLYPGYNPTYITDPVYDPVYALAEQYNKPVAVHTGATAGSNALLKYSHPLTLDEAAVLHPHVQLIMCHFGNPFLADAAAVAAKNENVAVDLSGLLEGLVDLPALLAEQKGYFDMLRAWLIYMGRFDRVMFGTDWPLANLGDYINLVLNLIPEAYVKDVFFSNANRIYHLNK